MADFKDFDYQIEVFNKSKDREYYAYLMDRGTAKSRPLLKDALYNYTKGRIDALVILCPNSVKTGWVAWPHMLEAGDEPDQTDLHIPEANAIKGVWVSNPRADDKKCWANFEARINQKPVRQLIVLAVNYEAILSDQLMGFLKDFCEEFRVMLVADESTRIGKPGSKRTRRATTLSKLARRRRILTGTPILKSPMKIFSQARFLSPLALGYTSFFPFRNRYAIMGGWKNKEIIDFQNLDELGAKIAEWSFRKQRLPGEGPPKVYHKRRVELTKEQAAAYKQMRDEFYTVVKGEEVTATIVLTQMMRLQQICGGYLHKDGKSIEIVPPARNPKMKETVALLEDMPGQAVVWCRFRDEIEGLAELLRDKKMSFFEFHGGLDDREKLRVRKDFQKGARDFVLAITQTGGIGINEFKVASDAIFFSRDFDTEQQEQAEGRTDRVGSEIHDSLRYYDVYVPGTVESKILRVLRGDAKLSAKILKDQYREWV